MKYAYDFHVHTALSPCGDIDMTPNNIVNMSLIKELDMIAITDHNCCGNAAAIINVAKETPLVVLPGIEAETQEEIHTVCLFSNLEATLELQKILFNALPNVSNRKDIFGEQLFFNEDDEIIGECDRLLLAAADLSIYELVDIVKNLGGVAVPAHVDRDYYSIITNLGLIPRDLDINYIEISKKTAVSKYLDNHTYLKRYKYLQSSDAHYLEDIFERKSFLDLDTLSCNSIIDFLKN